MHVSKAMHWYMHVGQSIHAFLLPNLGMGTPARSAWPKKWPVGLGHGLQFHRGHYTNVRLGRAEWHFRMGQPDGSVFLPYSGLGWISILGLTVEPGLGLGFERQDFFGPTWLGKCLSRYSCNTRELKS